MDKESSTTKTASETPEVLTCTTRLHRYYYDLNKPDQEKLWSELQKKLSDGRHLHESWGDVTGPARLPDGACESVETVVIDLTCVFNDQWNTIWPEPRGKCNGERVFDWYKFYEVRGRNVARGHWLEITDEMHAARMQTVSCGYCGKHYGRNIDQLSFEPLFAPEPADGFCHACLGSEYLEESQLHLLRLMPETVNRFATERAPLTADERVALLTEYHGQQVKGTEIRTTAKRAKQHAGILEKFQEKLDSVTKTTGNAVIERDGMLWLWNHNIDIENVIYYSHTKTFSFGWRKPLTASEKSHILDVISEFPFEYEFHKGH